MIGPRLIHTKEFAEFNLEEKVRYCNLSDLLLGLVAPSIPGFGYNPLQIVTFPRTSRKDLRVIANAFSLAMKTYKDAVDTVRLELTRALEPIDSDRFLHEKREQDVTNEYDKIKLLLHPDYTTEDDIVRLWGPLESSDVARRAVAIRKAQTNEPIGDSTGEFIADLHLYNRRIYMRAFTYLVSPKYDFDHNFALSEHGPSFVMQRFKMHLLEKAARNICEKINESTVDVRTQEGRQIIFDTSRITDIGGLTFVYDGAETSAYPKLSAGVDLIKKSRQLDDVISWSSIDYDDYRSTRMPLRRRKILAELTHYMGRSDSDMQDALEIQFVDRQNLIGLQELAGKPPDVYQQERRQGYRISTGPNRGKWQAFSDEQRQVILDIHEREGVFLSHLS